MLSFKVSAKFFMKITGNPVMWRNLDIFQKDVSILWLHKIAYISKDIAIVCQKLLHFCPLDSMIMLMWMGPIIRIEWTFD